MPIEKKSFSSMVISKSLDTASGEIGIGVDFVVAAVVSVEVMDKIGSAVPNRFAVV
jgi:hypothetical protein